MKLTSAFLIMLLHFSLDGAAQDSLFMKVHFLHGSKPRKEYRDVESKWFGGIHGGHAGVDISDGRILSLVPRGEFHWIAKKKSRHGVFVIHSEAAFYRMMGNSDSAKRTVVMIPITSSQKKTLDSLATSYTTTVPYDYAFLGMRCGSAAYDVLSQIGVVKKKSRTKMATTIFYPKLLRKKLTRRAEREGWAVEEGEGTRRRKWER